ncbi:uncharacterized protein A1O9_08953 [Exophiala aquamarina CBS 119918]|uniref:Glycosyl hydrolase family 13 catalytic domain-containing protein n=1 Tax=Exophiala aquamarina CBS 119918 TaxID=1182545 RepID=A0A072P5F1_9EURO|nr:uncharacterized protein A1O9_08953 [Exophiala aquamarina CBS 119918]KEF55299.1 hypothetical protein A1O9_08953 [Exophiala aquamarina CBS 119918]
MAKSLADQEIVTTINAKPPAKEFHPSPLAWEDQLLYFLLPDRFSDANENGYKDIQGQPVESGTTPQFQPQDSGNATLTDQDAAEWREAGTVFVGGTLDGLKSKLGYLGRLGVTAIWVGPIFKQVSKLQTYHGYGVQDFLDVDPRFGTREELKDLVATAHQHNIYVLLDIILNHSGNVFQYVARDPHYTGDTFDVKGFYDQDRQPNIPLGKVDEQKHPGAFPNAAVWPSELQDANCFTRKGQINSDGWDLEPEYLDGDFFDLKDIALGNSNPDNFTAPPALRALCACYKYWIAYADIDGYRIDTVKHMGDGPTRYFASVIHEYAATLGKDKFLLIGEITGSRAFETVEVTGLDAALGIGNVQEKLWRVPKGQASPAEYFDLFRNALFLNKGSHTWFRDRVVTMIDDHDQVWRGENKGRYCSEGSGKDLIVAAIALNLLTLGIPCIYYGTEQAFDGSGGADTYIREAMFGARFGAFRSKERHFFAEDGNPVWTGTAALASLRKNEIALRRGRQYLREISGDGAHFGFPFKIGNGPIRSVLAWSRLFADEEVVCAVSTDPANTLSVWVTVDAEVHPAVARDELRLLHSSSSSSSSSSGTGVVPDTIKVEARSGRSTVKLTVPPGGVVVYK